MGMWTEHPEDPVMAAGHPTWKLFSLQPWDGGKHSFVWFIRSGAIDIYFALTDIVYLLV